MLRFLAVATFILLFLLPTFSFASIIYVKNSLKEIGKSEQIPSYPENFKREKNSVNYITRTNGDKIIGGYQVVSYSVKGRGGDGTRSSTWLYSEGETKRIGLYSDAFQNPTNGSFENYIRDLNAHGVAVGTVDKFDADGNRAGFDAWIGDQNSSHRIPVTPLDVPYEDYRYFVHVSSINDNSQVIGTTVHRIDAGGLRTEAWVYKDGVLTNIGFTGPGYTTPGGYQQSRIFHQNENDHILGFSERFDGYVDKGRAAWQYSDGTITRLGFTDEQHTHGSGFQYSLTDGMNSQGQVIGRSSKFAGFQYIGASAWQFSEGVTTKIGIYDQQHTRDDGYVWSVPRRQSESGYVVGSSTRYQGNEHFGTSVWQYFNGTTINISPNNSEYISSEGKQSFHIRNQNENGQVVGIAQIYTGSESTGRALWLYSEGQHITLGLNDQDHTSRDGFRFSEHSQMNEAGQVAGYSLRYSNRKHTGQSAWQYSDGVTTRIGIFDSDHTRDRDGYQYSFVKGQNEAGQVIGGSTNYKKQERSNTAWFYDDATMITYTFDLPFEGEYSKGSYFYGLTDDGFAYGSYFTDDNEQRAFGFTTEQGFFDITEWMEEDLDSLNWAYIQDVNGINDSGMIFGKARDKDLNLVLFSAMFFGLNMDDSDTKIPLPNTAILILFGLAGLLVKKLTNLKQENQ